MDSLIGVFPREAPRETSSNAEVRLWEALREQLPDGWTAWHSTRVRPQFSLDGEIDFLLAVPGRGVILIEVKGGRIEVRDGRWFQNGHLLSKSPRDQGHAAIKKLTKQFRERFPSVSQPYIALASAFPETAFDAPPSNGDTQDAVLGKQDMTDLRGCLLALADSLLKPNETDIDAWRPAFHAIWGAEWTPDATLGGAATLALRRLATRDESQVNVLDAIGRNRRMCVLGGAGSGKSLLATEVARKWRTAGTEPIILCFTRALALRFRAHGFLASTVRELEAQIVSETGVAGDLGPVDQWSSDIWGRVPSLCLEALQRTAMRFDAMIVDEAQDLEDGDWDVVRALQEPRGRLWVFGDAAQAFWSSRGIPDDLQDVTFELPENHRNPGPLGAFARRYRAGTTDAEKAPKLPSGDEVRLVVTTSVESSVAHELQRLMDDGVEPGAIAVISLAGQSRTRIGAASRVGDFEVARADDDDADDFIVADTFLRFKGLERPYILVTELALGQESYGVRMHIALTRALVAAIVVCTESEAQADPMLVALRGR